MAPLATGDGFGVKLPVTQVIPVVDLTATQPMPAIRPDAAPSAQHMHRAQPTTTFVEDNDLEPQSPGRHALNDLMALPDPALELAAAPQRIIKALGGSEPQVKDPTKRLAVRLFRAARDMSRAREARCNQEDARLRAIDARIKEFASRWAHDDAHWDRVAAVLKAKQEATDAGQLVKAYEDDGTAAALYVVQELSHEITRRALAGSGVAQ
ncbi:MAG: hypothetical protein HOY79_20815 [Streptomyces sp.]|nr:hypothetical protein [Streptomyces sp.]